MNATMAMTSALESGTKVMGQMNKQMDPIAQQKLAQQFAMENDKAQVSDEMFSDLFDRCGGPLSLSPYATVSATLVRSVPEGLMSWRPVCLSA